MKSVRSLWNGSLWALLFSLLSGLLISGTAQAQLAGTLTQLYSFTGSETDGETPISLVQLLDGDLYGVTQGTANYTAGASVFFKITTAGNFSFLYENKCNPPSAVNCSAIGQGVSPLIAGADGNLYGTTYSSNSASSPNQGTFYQLTPQGTATPLYINNTGIGYLFDPEFYGNTQLVQAKDGSFYGTSENGSTNPGSTSGLIYHLVTSGGVTSLNILHSFATATNPDNTNYYVNSDGIQPASALIQANDGNFYGTAPLGGPNGSGTVFKMAPDGSGFTVLHVFGPINSTSAPYDVNGGQPYAGLVQGADGNLYGVTASGGAYQDGVIFRMALDGSGYTKLHDFNPTALSLTIAANPSSVPAGQSFALNWALTYSDGARPTSTMFIGQDGNFYGYTGHYAYDNEGTVTSDSMFQLTPSGQYTLVYQFFLDSDGSAYFPSSLIQGSDGNFYGTTSNGGATGTTTEYGTVFQISTTTPQSPACTASGSWNGAQFSTGSQTLTAPTTPGSYTYTLTCPANGSPLGDGATSPISTNSATLTVTAAATPTVTLTANPTTLTLGQSTTLSWTTTNANSCSASSTDGDFSGSQAPQSDPVVVTPTMTGTDTYTLTCTGDGGSATGTAMVTVNAVATPPPAAPTVTLTANPSSVTLGQSTTLSWSSTNAVSCTASSTDGDYSGSESISGTQSVTPTAVGNDVYTLSCTGNGGSASATASVNVTAAATSPPAPAPTVMISINPTTITVGGSASLIWSSTNALACSASGAWSGAEPTSGSLSESPASVGTYTYTLSCSGVEGTTPATASATLNATTAAPPPPATPTVTLTANPASITLGQSTVLSWSSTNASACSASSSDNSYTGPEPTGGTISETPAAIGTVTYTLSCANSAGVTASAMASVSVTAPVPLAPTVTIAANPPAITLGANTTLSWSSTNVTSCTASGAWSGTEATAGQATETPSTAGPLVYTLSCSGPGGVATAAAAVIVSPAGATTSLSGKVGTGGIGLDSLFGLSALALLRRRRLRKSFGIARIARITGIAGLGGLLALLPNTTPAQDLKFDPSAAYVGIRGGLGTYGYANNGQLGTTLASQGDASTSVDIDRHRLVGAVYAGIPFYDRLSVEAGFVDAGEYNVHIATQSSDIPQVAHDVLHDLKPAGRGVTLGLGGPVDIGRWLAAEPHLGMLIYQSKQQVSTATANYSDNSYGVGLDAGFALLLHPIRPVYLGAGIECLDAQHGCGVKLITAQLEYHWGR